MIRTIGLLLIFILYPLFSNCYAQFITFNIKVEPEINTKVEQELIFGTFVSNSGEQKINLGDYNMGVFSIRALHTQSLFLLFEHSDELLNTDSRIQASIPITLSMAYSNSTSQNYTNTKNTTLAENDMAYISMDDIDNSANNEVWKSIYVFVYGSVIINDIPNGVYVGDINLTIEYD